MQSKESVKEQGTAEMNTWHVFLFLFVGLFLLIGIVNCGGKETAGMQAPQKLLQEFIVQKYMMVDPAFADFYVKDERAAVSEQVSQSIQAKEAAGTIEGLRNATYDFSGLQMLVIGETEDYVHDEVVKFIKVAVKGNYTMQLQEESKTISTDKVITLELVDSLWKVTEKLNPWG